MNHRVIIDSLLAVIALGPAIALAQSPPERDGLNVAAALEKTLVDVIAAAQPSVVAIARTPRPQAQAPNETALLITEAFGDLQVQSAQAQANTVAAGVIIDPSGLVLTEFLAVREGDTHVVTLTSGETFPADIKAADPRSGLAVLAINTNPKPLPQAGTPPLPVPQPPQTPTPPTTFPAIRLGNADDLRKGQFVVAIGNPYAIRSDGQPTTSWGIVANLARKAPPGTNLNDAPGPNQDYRTTLHHLGSLIQTDAGLGWSAGGGALVNLRGELIGLTTTAAAIAGHEQPAGYAIPINSTFRRIIDTLKDGREVEYGLLGINLSMGVPLGGNMDQSRVVVQQTYEGSPGALAGLKPGDVILAVGDKQVRDVDQLQLSISSQPPSSDTTIEYSRNGNLGKAQVRLAKLSVSGNKVVTNRPQAWRGIRVDYATAVDPLKLPEVIQSKAIDPEGCVLVAAVEPDSVAARAGVREGMFISQVGGERVRTPVEFYAAAQKLGDVGITLDIKLTQPIQPANENDANPKNPGGPPPQP